MDIESTPSVSICVTTYNRGDVLPLTIESILNQTFRDFELIIQDDCSTDNTQEICLKYVQNDKRVRYFTNKVNLKMPGNLNAAIQNARGKYIANLHDGDVYRPDLIFKWKTALDNNPTAAFVFNDYSNKSTFGNTWYSKDPIQNGMGKFEIFFHFTDTITCCVWGTVMARADAYKKYGLFNPTFGFISDVEMWLRLAKHQTFAYIPEQLISLAPREKTHTYAYPHWRELYWRFHILKQSLLLYKDDLPIFYKNVIYKLPFLIQKNYAFNMLLLIKHRQWNRVNEGFAIWKTSPFFILRIFGIILGKQRNLPSWYSNNYWSDILFFD